MSGDTSSQAVVDWVQTHLGRCLEAHSRCRILEDHVLPTRLVSVKSFDDSPDIVLVDSSKVPPSSKYIALSHCWGKYKMQCLTTASTYDQQLRRISWESLTRTFQDAVDFTRRLSIEYIWIDSICIIQGDKADWLREAGNMLSVYKNAHATIVNVHAEDGSKGLYWKNIGNKPRGRNYPGARRFPTFHDWLAPNLPAEAPLFFRAWCYQERLISPRVVYFTRQEVLWECFTNVACECSRTITSFDVDNPKTNYIAAFLDDEHDELRADVMARTKQTAFNLGAPSGTQTRDLDQHKARHNYRIKEWHNIIEQYSELQITNILDRLPALGAVAKNFQQVRKGERYLAGLWSGSLIDDLLWFPTEAVRHRLKTWVAPSWSWASISGCIQYYEPLQDYVAKIISAECQYKENDPFVLALNGSLMLESSVITFTLRKLEATKKTPEKWFLLHEATRRKITMFGKPKSDSDSEASELDSSETDDSDDVLSLEKIKEAHMELDDSNDDIIDHISFFLDDESILEDSKPIFAIVLGKGTNGEIFHLLLIESNITNDLNKSYFVRVGIISDRSNEDELETVLNQNKEIKTFVII
ncbi:heterokaryon incompatibility protein [Rutstroemia sp. NJR-2017a BVV2]|nr:heterokaryon incompatibility protein [Rutstroemia sp. NJR-2017a BVV2]